MVQHKKKAKHTIEGKNKRNKVLQEHTPPYVSIGVDVSGAGEGSPDIPENSERLHISTHNTETVKEDKVVDAKLEMARRELARRRLLRFVKYRFPSYRENWHHKVLADALERVENGTLKRLIVDMPPRHGKSELVSVNFPAWCMGRDKDRSIMAASYAASLATSFGRQVRNIMDTKEYQNLFDTRLAEDAQAKGSWATNGRGEYNAIGVGGSATGKGAGILIIDDPIKNREEADSEVISENIWDWYKSTARTRLTPDGSIVIVMTRWKDDDLVGRVLEEQKTNGGEPWTVITLPAIAEEDDEYRKEGEALWANHFTIENLEATKKDIGTYEFASQYQQNPVNRETQIFKEEMFRYIGINEVMKKVTNCFITIDTQGKHKGESNSKKSDFTGITINWVDSENIWYLKSYHKKVSETELFDLIFELHAAYKPQAIGIEKTMFVDAIQPFLTVEMARRNVFPNVVELTHGGTAKENRIKWLVPRYERGHIYHIEGMCTDLEKELLRFPASKHDDTMDSAAYQTQIAQPPNTSFDYAEFERDELLPSEKLWDDIGV